MKRRARVTAAVLAGVVGVAVAAGLARPGMAAASASGWTPMFAAATSGGYLSVAAISKTNVWAVGEHYANQTVYQPMVEHYNGSHWKPVAFPKVAVTTDTVEATSATNVWVFGYSKSPIYSASTAAYLWDGKHWHRIPVPAGTDIYRSVVLGPRDVWAFGDSATVDGNVFHWNGSTWKAYDINLMVDGIAASSVNNVGLAASSASDVWLIGQTGTSEKTGKLKAYGWNGSRWLGVATPHPLPDLGLGLTVLSPSNVWIGWASSTKNYGFTIKAAHWDGHAWTTVTAPNGLAANSTDIVPDARGGYWFGPFVDWTGKAWIGVPDLSPNSGRDVFDDVVRIPGTAVFLAGGSAMSPHASWPHPVIYWHTVG